MSDTGALEIPSEPEDVTYDPKEEVHIKLKK